MHILAADGFFYVPSIDIDTASLEKLFIHKIFKMLLKKGLITERVIELINSWKHTGFGVCSDRRYMDPLVCLPVRGSDEDYCFYLRIIRL